MNPNATNTGIENSEGEGTGSSTLRELVIGGVNRLGLATAASLAVLTADVRQATAEELRIALNGEEGVTELIDNEDELKLPTEISFTNGAGENFVISGNQEAVFTAWSLQQVFLTIPAQFKTGIEQQWFSLSVANMQTVLDIHAGTEKLEGDSQAHEFYHKMLRAFLELGREYYIKHAPISDPEGWEGYSAKEISEDWSDFVVKYIEGTTNTDLDYRVIGNPDFFNGISIFFPNHPVTAEIKKELDIIVADSQILELIKVRDSLRGLNATLGSVNDTVTN